MDVFKKAFLAGLGALSLSRERAQEMINELVKAGEVHEQEGRDLVEDMLKKATAVREELEGTIQSQVKSVYSKINLASLEQLKKLEKRIQELERDLSQAAARKTGTSAKPRKKTAAKTKRTSR